MPKVRARLGRVDSRRPKLKDVIVRLIQVKGRVWRTEAEFFEAWSAARRQVYRTFEWEKFKLKVWQRSKWVCESCKQRPAREIHHRIRVYDDPRLICTLSNVLHVCTQCHQAAHPGVAA